MRLPDFLREEDEHEIRLAGHRIGLANVVKLYNAGYSAEMIGACFPTLPLSLVHHVIAFYLDNQAEVDAHVAAHEQAIDRQEQQSRRSNPTLPAADLRKRLATIRQAGQG